MELHGLEKMRVPSQKSCIRSPGDCHNVPPRVEFPTGFSENQPEILVCGSGGDKEVVVLACSVGNEHLVHCDVGGLRRGGEGCAKPQSLYIPFTEATL